MASRTAGPGGNREVSASRGRKEGGAATGTRARAPLLPGRGREGEARPAGLGLSGPSPGTRALFEGGLLLVTEEKGGLLAEKMWGEALFPVGLGLREVSVGSPRREGQCDREWG